MNYTVDTTALQKAMIDANIRTYTELSEKTGVNRNTIADIVKGESKPSTIVIEKISRVLNLESAEVGRIFFNSHLA